MKVEIEVIRTETVKPSSPTPDDHRNHPLSLTDLTSSTMLIPIILCFPSHTQLTNSYKFNHLQKSLSEALTLYYPLAGRFVDNYIRVDCNDSGVPLTETKFNCELSQVINDPECGEIVNKFLPSGWDIPSDLPLVIQANFFKCGGMAIGIGFSHKIGDVPSFIMFIHWLANIAHHHINDTYLLSPPVFDCASLFPPKDLPSAEPGHGNGEKLGIVTKRFILSPSSVVDLKHKYADHTGLPTKVEAVSAFVWSRLMASTQEITAEASKTFLVADAVDLRPVGDPPIPASSFGNIGWISMATASGKDLGEDRGLVGKMREGGRNVNAEIVSKLRQSNFEVFKETMEKFSDPSMVACITSSFCGFDLYGADFGWGKPIWVASATFPVKNAVILMDSRSGEDGVEVWVNLIREDMAKFEVDEMFLSFVSSPTD